MKRHLFAMSGVTTEDRHRVTAAIDDAVLSSGGWVVDHTLFSNVAITLRLELPVSKLDDVRRRVMEAGVKLDDDSLVPTGDMAGGDETQTEEMAVSLMITFIHDEHDLRRTIPAVPG